MMDFGGASSASSYVIMMCRNSLCQTWENTSAFIAYHFFHKTIRPYKIDRIDKMKLPSLLTNTVVSLQLASGVHAE